MFRIFILLYGLSLTQAYTIKVSGHVELGNQLTKIFKELCTQLVDNGVIPKEVVKNYGNDQNPEDQNKEPISIKQEDGINSNENDRTYKKHSKRKDKSAQNDDNAPVLDKMMQSDLEKLHLYGYHKHPTKKPEDFTGKPLNNVHV